MKRAKEDKYIFTEEIDYSKTSKPSIWGNGDKATLKILNKEKVKGKWLNLASGDGRYNDLLLKKVEVVTALDIDPSALKKLYKNTPNKYKSKLKTKIFDITKKFPFKNNSFDGVFCTGVLHIFPKRVLKKIILEINRILKNKGKAIIDFATDIKRTKNDGSKLTFGKEPLYKTKEAEKLLKSLFLTHKVRMTKSKVIEHMEANPPYTLNCNFIILIADKLNVKEAKCQKSTENIFQKYYLLITITERPVF